MLLLLTIGIQSRSLRPRTNKYTISGHDVAPTTKLAQSASLQDNGDSVRVDRSVPQQRSPIYQTISTPDPLQRESNAVVGSIWAQKSNVLTVKHLSLRPRYIPFTNLLNGYRMNWDGFQALQPSVYAADALITLFSKVLNMVRYSFSKQSPLNSFEIKYGSMKIGMYCRDRVIRWKIVVDLLQDFLDKAKRGLLGSFLGRLTHKEVNAAIIWFGVTIGGIVLVRGGPLDIEGGDAVFNNIIG